MVSSATITGILTEAVEAPSGGNSQPWHFEVHDGHIRCIADPENDNHILNVEHRGTHIAHGALIENILALAGARDIGTVLTLFPNSTRPEITAEIICGEGSVYDASRAHAIALRTTNRRAYSNNSIASKTLHTVRSVGNTPTTTVTVIEKRDDIKAIATAVAAYEHVMLNNDRLRKQFFEEEVVWTRNEEAQRGGFFVKTLELKGPQEFIFRQFRNNTFSRFARTIGLPALIAKGNANVYASAGAMIAFILSDTSRTTYIDLGRALQRVWLEATTHTLSLQPMTGVLYLHEYLTRHTDDSTISTTQRIEIAQAHKNICMHTNTHSGTLAFCARIGMAEPPTHRAHKKPPRIIFTHTP